MKHKRMGKPCGRSFLDNRIKTFLPNRDPWATDPMDPLPPHLKAILISAEKLPLIRKEFDRNIPFQGVDDAAK